MNDRHKDLHALLASLGQPSRFRIALLLLEREHSVGELATLVGLSQSCTTRHVQALERAGVIRARRDGKRVMVGIERGRAGVAELIDWLGPDASVPAVGPAELRDYAARSGRPAAPRAPHARRKRAQARAGGAADPPLEEEPPAREPGSGTPPAPAEDEEARPGGVHDTLEDYLL